MTRDRARVLLLLILLAGAFFRFAGINWDHNHHLHPDERFISMVDDKLSGAEVSRGTRLGTVRVEPLQQRLRVLRLRNTSHAARARALGSLVRLRGYDGTYLVGRAVSATLDLLTVWLVYRIVRRFSGRRTALAGAGFLAFAPPRHPAFPLLDRRHSSDDLFRRGAARGRADRAGAPANLRPDGGRRDDGARRFLQDHRPFSAPSDRRALSIAEWSRPPAADPCTHAPGRAFLRLAGLTPRFSLVAAVATIRAAFPHAFLGGACSLSARSALAQGPDGSGEPDELPLRDFLPTSSGPDGRFSFPSATSWCGARLPFWGIPALVALVWGPSRSCAGGGWRSRPSCSTRSFFSVTTV